MSFLAECMYCGKKVRAPAQALGTSGQCPKCANFFTLVPMEGDLTTGSGKKAAVLGKAEVAKTPAALKTTPPPANRTTAEMPVIAEAPPPPPKIPWIEPWGAAALL